LHSGRKQTLLQPVLPLALVGTVFKYLLAPYSLCG
jgi:hypothetical protein